jgi:hypothetical protein
LSRRRGKRQDESLRRWGKEWGSKENILRGKLLSVLKEDSGFPFY